MLVLIITRNEVTKLPIKLSCQLIDKKRFLLGRRLEFKTWTGNGAARFSMETNQSSDIWTNLIAECYINTYLWSEFKKGNKKIEIEIKIWFHLILFSNDRIHRTRLIWIESWRVGTRFELDLKATPEPVWNVSRGSEAYCYRGRWKANGGIWSNGRKLKSGREPTGCHSSLWVR